MPMIRAIVFLLKVALLVTLAVWVADRPGTVSIDWMEYTFTVHVGLFLLAALGVMLFGMFAFRVIMDIVNLPQTIQRMRERRRHDKGYRSLTLGLTAVAAGDTKHAGYHAFRARKFMPRDKGLPVLLEAQVARMEGRDEDAQKKFTNLMKNKDTAFIGVRGLLQAAMEKEDHTHALSMAREALKLYPKQPWILRVVYQLEIRAHDWAAAHKTLDRLEKAKGMETPDIESDRVAMLLAEVDDLLSRDERDAAFKKLKEAHKIDGHFAPTLERLVPQYVQRRKRAHAQKLIEKAWKSAPHPDLVKLWDLVIPKSRKSETMGRVRWFEKLRDMNVETTHGLLALAEVELEEGLWAEVRNNLMAAERVMPSRKLYQLWADLEERTTHDEDAVAEWMMKAEEQPADKIWTCSETGRVYTRWSPLAEPHNSFNTIIWAVPGAVRGALHAPSMTETLLEAPG